MMRITFKQGLMALTVAATAVSLAACADDYGPRPYRYSAYDAGAVARVDRGVVVGVRPIEFGSGDTGNATVLGAIVGGVIGNAVSHGRDRGLATAGGAVAGGLVGNAAASDNRHPGFAYTIQLARSGRMIEIPQADAQPIPNGAPVNIIYEGGRARVVPARGAYGPPPPPPGSYPPPPPPPPPPSGHY